MAFYDIDDNENYFASVIEMLRHYFALGDIAADEELWRRVQNLNECPIDPLRIVKCNYRPFETKYIYYTTTIGIISHPRYAVMKNLLPWYWDFTIMAQIQRMQNYTPETLQRVIQDAEQDWLELPLNAKFLANLNKWRVAIHLLSLQNKQLKLF